MHSCTFDFLRMRYFVKALGIGATSGPCVGFLGTSLCVFFTCLSVSDLALSLEVPVSHTQMAVLVPPVITSFKFGHMAQRIGPHSDRHSYTTNAWNKIEEKDRRLVLARGCRGGEDRFMLAVSFTKFYLNNQLFHQHQRIWLLYVTNPEKTFRITT